MNAVRVLVVEDSLTVRKYLVEVLSKDPTIQVVGEASDGETAFELCRTLRPSVVTMDMMLAGRSGLYATEQIMGFCPTPILIVSASTNRGEVFRTYEALAAGAVDVIEKSLQVDSEWERALIDKLRLVARIRVITHPRARLKQVEPTIRDLEARAAFDLVAIGASTGGPSAVLSVLQSLPRHFPRPVLIVLHIAAPFAQDLAEWVGTQIVLPVRQAQDGELIPSGGCVLFAPPGRHLEVRAGRLTLTDHPERHFCRPSVDVLFESLVRSGTPALACLLTGMGRDGAAGMLAVRRAGGVTIAQDEETSVVFGMPGEAVRLGAAELVRPLQQIGPLIASLAADERER